MTNVIADGVTSSPYMADVALAQFALTKYNTARFSYMNCLFGAVPNTSDRSQPE